MQSPSRRVAVGLLLATLLSPLAAQTKKPPKPTPPKDDRTTQRDPAIKAIDQFVKKRRVDKKDGDWRTKLTAPPQLEFDPKRDYEWHIETNKGVLVARLFPDSASAHVASVIHLTRLGFYDGLVFHRVIKEFMAQGGCPLGNGNGNPGYFMETVKDSPRKHDKAGVLSMANEEGKAKTEGSQFFVTFAPAPHLDGKHTIFAEITSGDAVLKAPEACGGDINNDKPTEKLEVVRAWIVVAEKPAAKAPAK